MCRDRNRQFDCSGEFARDRDGGQSRCELRQVGVADTIPGAGGTLKPRIPEDPRHQVCQRQAAGTRAEGAGPNCAHNIHRGGSAFSRPMAAGQARRAGVPTAIGGKLGERSAVGTRPSHLRPGSRQERSQPGTFNTARNRPFGLWPAGRIRTGTGVPNRAAKSRIGQDAAPCSSPGVTCD